MRYAPHLGDKGEPAAPDLADGAAAHEHTLRGVGPVDPPELDLGIIPASIENVGLSDAIGGQHALCVLCIDGEIGTGTHLRRRQSAFRLEQSATKIKRAIMIGEAEYGAIGTGDLPAPAERRRARVEMGLQSWREGFHGRSPAIMTAPPTWQLSP